MYSPFCVLYKNLAVSVRTLARLPTYVPYSDLCYVVLSDTTTHLQGAAGKDAPADFLACRTYFVAYLDSFHALVSV